MLQSALKRCQTQKPYLRGDLVKWLQAFGAKDGAASAGIQSAFIVNFNTRQERRDRGVARRIEFRQPASPKSRMSLNRKQPASVLLLLLD